MNLDRVYLDYNATSPLSASVLDWLKSGDVLFANPSSQHSRGKAARKQVNDTRTFLHKTFELPEKDTALFFHSGATEAFLTVTHSFTEWARKEGKELLVCYSSIDHPAVLTLKERNWGPHVHFHQLNVGTDLTYDYKVNITFLKQYKDEKPKTIILYHHLWVHNETGFVSPLEELKSLRAVPELYVHVDAVQAPGKITEWRSLTEGDLWTFSGHKFGALKGIGFTFLKKTIPFTALMTGGGQQSGMRSGTENVHGIRSLELALPDLMKVNIEKTMRQRDDFEKEVEKMLEGIGGVLKGPRRNSNTIYFYFNDLTSDVAIALFDLNGLELSAGSACSSGSAKASPVLLQMKLVGVAKNGIRLSWGFEISEAELVQIKVRMQKVLRKMKSV